MKTLLLAGALCCPLAEVFGQVQAVQLPSEQPIDTASYWRQLLKKSEQQLGLVSVENSPHAFHYRVSDGGLVLDLWRQDTVLQGSLTCWVKEADELLGPLGRIYYHRYDLGATQAADMGRLLKTSGILQLPSDQNIAGWQQGLDGETILTQCYDGKKYSLKQYWTPSAQRGLAEAVLVQQFYAELLQLANIAIVRQAFETEIPFPCYTTYEASITCRIARSQAEYWRHKREVEKYVRQLKTKED